MGRVDLVAAPIRYPRTPLLVLLFVATLPAVGLYFLFQWADEEADRYEADRLSSVETAPDESETDAAVVITPALPTALFDYRRTPESVSDVANASQLGRDLAPVYSFVNADSCAAVSVDGVAAAAINPDVPVIPASTQKLVTAAVALEVLGADHRFTTTVASPSPVDGVVEGDVYLIGGGDPLLTSDDYPIEDDRRPAFNTTSLDRLADAFVANGITRITGTVIGDGTRYDDEWFVDSWAEGVAGNDAGPYDALLVNDARVLGRGFTETDPNEAAAREFVRLLGNRGIRVNNGWGSGIADATVPVIGTVESADLVGVLTEMLETSDNNTAELLLKEIGLVGLADGSRAGGLNVVDGKLREWGVPMDGIRLVDGSGLSANARTTCAAMLTVLQREAGGPIEGALPVAAVNGTLADEFTESPMSGRLRAKTGTLGNPPFDQEPLAAKALAGYVSTAEPETIEFVLILNAPDITEDGKYVALWTALGERLDTYPSGPSADDLGPR
ncbi:MAG: D-alanyl-D-alanine carboxypeptidase/D-alanyl-D-alanine-endopeptidase [Ilumatobacteraceae bacterium]